MPRPVTVGYGITVWECGICGRRYLTEERAIVCEGLGLAPVYPVGMIYTLEWSCVTKVVFAVAAMEREENGHGYAVNKAWACRDNRYGDAIADDDCCRGPGRDRLQPPDPSFPAFGRMVAALREKGIEPTVWDGERPVPLEEFLAGRAAGVDESGVADGRKRAEGGSS